MSADLADSRKADEEASEANHVGLTAAQKQEIATATIDTNLRQGDLGVGVDSVSEIQTSVAPSETWLREDLEKVYALLSGHVGIDGVSRTHRAPCSIHGRGHVVLPLVAIVCRVEIVFFAGGWHMCVGSRGLGKNRGGYCRTATPFVASVPDRNGSRIG